MIDAIALEKLGKPTVTITHDRFEAIARLHCRNLGIPELAFVVQNAPAGGTVVVGPDDSANTAEAVRCAEMVIAGLTTLGQREVAG